MHKKDINFLGAIPRKKLIEIELESEYFIYPCSYEELFCISCAEAQYAGMFPITSGIGALSTTNMGEVVVTDANNPHNDRIFVKKVLEWMKGNQVVIENERNRIQRTAKVRFSPTRILECGMRRCLSENYVD
jgi:hypothetical protein